MQFLKALMGLTGMSVSSHIEDTLCKYLSVSGNFGEYTNRDDFLLALINLSSETMSPFGFG
ncbi:MAG: hypothetical protein ACJ70T_06895 [Nitrososphaera sp.]